MLNMNHMYLFYRKINITYETFTKKFHLLVQLFIFSKYHDESWSFIKQFQKGNRIEIGWNAFYNKLA